MRFITSPMQGHSARSRINELTCCFSTVKKVEEDNIFIFILNSSAQATGYVSCDNTALSIIANKAKQSV